MVQASTALVAAMDGGELTAISDAARAAGALEGQDPALDRLLGDALANHLLRADDGAALLKANPDPKDPAWVDAAMDAALRTADRPWMAQLLTAQGLTLNLDNPVVAQVERLAARDAAVDHDLLAQVVTACELVDGRPHLGRRPVDLPVPSTLQRTLKLLGATAIVVARSTLVYSPKSAHGTTWKCQGGWLPASSYTSIPFPMPPKGVILAVSDGHTTGYIELDSTRQGAWASVSSDPKLVARWLQAAAMLEGIQTQDDAEAQVLARFGPGLALPAEQATEPKPTTP